MKKLLPATYERYKSVLEALDKETKDIECCIKCNIPVHSFGGLMSTLRKRGIDIGRARGRYVLRTKLKIAIEMLGEIREETTEVSKLVKKMKPGLPEKQMCDAGGMYWWGIITRHDSIDCRIPDHGRMA